MELIDQQEALYAIEKCHKRCCRTDSNGDEWIHYETALNELEAIPTVQPKHGKWIPVNKKRNWYNGYYKTACYCSNCKDYYTTSPEEMNFCPHCGADMKGDSDAAD